MLRYYVTLVLLINTNLNLKGEKNKTLILEPEPESVILLFQSRVGFWNFNKIDTARVLYTVRIGTQTYYTSIRIHTDNNH